MEEKAVERYPDGLISSSAVLNFFFFTSHYIPEISSERWSAFMYTSRMSVKHASQL